VLSVIAIIVTLITQSAYGKALDKVTNTGSTPKASSATIKKDNLAACKTLLGDDMKIVTGIPDLITGIGDNATTKQQDQLEKTHLKIEDARKQAESGLAGHLASLDTPFKQAYDVMHGGGGSIDMDTSHVENDITNVMNDCADAGYKIADTNTDESSDSSVDEKPLASVSGGKYAGKDNTGFGSGTFTVRNDSDKPLKSVSLTVSELDASGNILQETYPQLDSDLQPGQSANLEYLLSPDDLTKTRSVQVTKLSWMLDDNGDGFQEVSVSSDPVQVK
jgi:hypothetical protein